MVVCKFFQQGYCRYGQSCRFEHIYGTKYSYHAKSPQPAQTSQWSGSSASQSVTDDQLIKQVQSDMQAALHGGQWLLSCYSPFKEKPIFPGLTDLSPEEARLFMYEAKANNTVDQAAAYITNLIKENRFRYEQLLQPTQDIIRTLRNIYNGDSSASLFSNVGQGTQGSDASSVFRSAAQSSFGQSTGSIFGNTNSQPQSIFAQANQNIFANQVQNQNVFSSNQQQNVFNSPPAQNVFAPANTDPAKSIFAQANVSSFGPAQTQQAPSPSQNIFATASQHFSDDPFKQNAPFGQNQTSNIFQSSANVFEQTNESGVYSDEATLKEDDVKAFEAAEFKLGFVPEIAPPKYLCV